MKVLLNRLGDLVAPAAILTLILLSAACVSADNTTETTDPPADHGSVDHDDTESDASVTGVLIAVEGDLTATTHLEILTKDGTTMSFSVAEGALFDGGPVSHVRDHLISGEPITIDYVILDDGQLQATYLEDSHDS